jgi:ribosomal protein S20
MSFTYTETLANPDRNVKNEKFCSHLSTFFKKTHGILEQEDFQAVSRATGETETKQENIPILA